MSIRTNLLLGVGLLALSATAAAAVPAVVRNDLNLRSGPGTGYAVVGALPAGATVDVGGCTGRWCTVAYGGEQGYANRSYLDLGAAGAGGPAVGVYTEEVPGPTYGYVDPDYYGDGYPYGYYGDDDYGPGVSFGLGWGGGGWRHGHRGGWRPGDGRGPRVVSPAPGSDPGFVGAPRGDRGGLRGPGASARFNAGGPGGAGFSGRAGGGFRGGAGPAPAPAARGGGGFAGARGGGTVGAGGGGAGAPGGGGGGAGAPR
jgi:uncharacterized protein YraI